MAPPPVSRLIRAWLVTAVSDGLFSSVLSRFFYGSTVTRLWQGVASTVLGPGALEGGTRTALIGVLMHFGVAFGWSTLFFVLASRSSWLRSRITTWSGVAIAAAIYGPCIWMVMSLGVIPSLTHRPPAITVRWWVQFFGHMVFVALPIVASIGAPLGEDRR